MVSPMILELPSGELLDRIRRELNEDLNTRDRDVAAVKEWLRQQPHLPDEWEVNDIKNFLRACNFSLEKTKKKLDMLFTIRTACPEFFTDRDINRPELVNIIRLSLPKLTPEGRRVSICQALDKDIVKVDQLIYGLRVATMGADARMIEEVNGVAGEVVIVDAAVLTLSHLAQHIPASTLTKFCIFVQSAYAVKIKEIHVINAPTFIDAAYSLVKPFFKKKLQERMNFHKHLSGLYEFIPKEILPTEYGGNAGSLVDLIEAWIKKLAQYKLV